MGGMEMMLKSMGFDISEFQGFISGMKELMLKFNADLEAIKIKQVELEQNQRAILATTARLADALDPSCSDAMPGVEHGR